MCDCTQRWIVTGGRHHRNLLAAGASGLSNRTRTNAFFPTVSVSGPNGFTFSYSTGTGEIQTLGFLSTTATGQLEIAGPNSLLEFSGFTLIGFITTPADPIVRWSRGAAPSGDQYEAINLAGTVLWNDAPPATGSLGGDPCGSSPK